MLPAYGREGSDCISPLREHSREGRPDPLSTRFERQLDRESAKNTPEGCFRGLGEPGAIGARSLGGCRWGSLGTWHGAAPMRLEAIADPRSTLQRCSQGLPPTPSITGRV